VKEGELEMATLADSEDAASTNFTCGSHFYEEVEDTKDSVWVVQVIVIIYHGAISWGIVKKSHQSYVCQPGNRANIVPGSIENIIKRWRY
jgi:hypothetical protein